MNLQILELREVVPRTTFSECKNCTAAKTRFPLDNENYHRGSSRISSRKQISEVQNAIFINTTISAFEICV